MRLIPCLLALSLTLEFASLDSGLLLLPQVAMLALTLVMIEEWTAEIHVRELCFRL